MSSDLSGLPLELEELKTDEKPHDPAIKKPKFELSFVSKMSLERILIILIFIVTIVLLILLVVILHSTVVTRPRILDEVETPCLTVPCLQAAVEIKSSLNTSVDPCYDFNQFACGKWESEQVIPKGSDMYSIFEILNSKLYKIQKRLLEGSKFKSISPVYSKAIGLYNSCVNLDKLNDLGSKPLENYIKKLFGKYGGWEMQSDGMDSSLSKWDWMKVIEDPLIEGPVFNILVKVDERNSSRNIFNVYLASLLWYKNVLQNSEKPGNRKIIDHLRQYIFDILKLLNLNKNKFNEIDEILKLGIQMSKNYPTDEESRKLKNTYNIMKVKELQNNYCPELNWKEIFKRRMEMVNMQLSDDMEVNVVNPEHLRQICKLFKSDPEPKRVFHNYVIWMSIFTRIAYLSEDFLRAKEKFEKVAYEEFEKRDRWEHCISVVQNNMDLILGSMYVKSNVPKETKSQVKEMIDLIKAKFRENILSITWIDEKTKSEAIEKIDAISPLIGYSDSLLNVTYVEKAFDDIEISEESYFENMDKLMNRKIFQSLRSLQKRPENSILSNVPRLDAYYNVYKNEIVFASGILQSPFFESGFPRSLNYGGIGNMMGQETIHALRDSRSKYNSQGNFSFGKSEEAQKALKMKADCFIKQYSKYSIHGHYIKGARNLLENIADNGGIRLSYQVYKYLENKFGKGKRLPGLNFTNDQLFFISFGRLWCNLETKESIISRILSYSVIPNRYRVIGTLSNVKEFAEAFNCPLGSPMNPPEKCILW